VLLLLGAVPLLLVVLQQLVLLLLLLLLMELLRRVTELLQEGTLVGAVLLVLAMVVVGVVRPMLCCGVGQQLDWQLQRALRLLIAVCPSAAGCHVGGCSMELLLVGVVP
jgi:hypothetical protein